MSVGSAISVILNKNTASVLIQATIGALTIYYMHKQTMAIFRNLRRVNIVELLRYCIVPLLNELRHYREVLTEYSYPSPFKLSKLDILGIVKSYTMTEALAKNINNSILASNLIERLEIEIDRIKRHRKHRFIIVKQESLQNEWHNRLSRYNEKYNELSKLAKQVEDAVKELLRKEYSDKLHEAFKAQNVFGSVEAFLEDAAKRFLEQLSHLEHGGRILAGPWLYLDAHLLKELAGRDDVQRLLMQIRELRKELFIELEQLIEILEKVRDRLVHEYNISPMEETPPEAALKPREILY